MRTPHDTDQTDRTTEMYSNLPEDWYAGVILHFRQCNSSLCKSLGRHCTFLENSHRSLLTIVRYQVGQEFSDSVMGLCLPSIMRNLSGVFNQNSGLLYLGYILYLIFTLFVVYLVSFCRLVSIDIIILAFIHHHPLYTCKSFQSFLFLYFPPPSVFL